MPVGGGTRIRGPLQGQTLSINNDVLDHPDSSRAFLSLSEALFYFLGKNSTW